MVDQVKGQTHNVDLHHVPFVAAEWIQHSKTKACLFSGTLSSDNDKN